MIGLPLSAATRLSLPWPGWAISTDGSFWKIAATATIGMFSRAKLSGTKEFGRDVEVEHAGGAAAGRGSPAARPAAAFTSSPWRSVDAGGDRLIDSRRARPRLFQSVPKLTVSAAAARIPVVPAQSASEMARKMRAERCIPPRCLWLKAPASVVGALVRASSRARYRNSWRDYAIDRAKSPQGAPCRRQRRAQGRRP